VHRTRSRSVARGAGSRKLEAMVDGGNRRGVFDGNVTKYNNISSSSFKPMAHYKTPISSWIAAKVMSTKS
jgi:hypothetical protein